MSENHSPKISIIVPVYKVEQYLPKCVDSILAQTYQDWELLLIDDGSPDKSGKICDEYAQKDERIRVFHKENGGVSSARNLGLDYAEGDYVMFVDSDDWISNECLQVCFDEIKKDKLDALQFGFISVTDDLEIPRVKIATLLLNGEKYIQTNNFNVCVWGGIYKRVIIEEYKLRFPKELKLAEDQIFVLSFIRKAVRIKYLDHAMYYYLQRSDSAVHTPKSEDMLKSCEYLIEFGSHWPVLKSHIDSMIIIFIFDLIKNNDVSYRILKKIYIKQNVIINKKTSRILNLFSKMAKISFTLACCAIHINNIKTKVIRANFNSK